MAERVRSQYTNLVKLKLDQRSLKRTRKQIQNFRSEVAKILKLKVDVGGLGVTKKGKGGYGNSLDEDYKVRKSLDKMEQSRQKREIDLIKLRQAEAKRVSSEQSARRRQAVLGLTSSGGNKASNTLFADMLREEGKRKSAPLQNAHVKRYQEQLKFNELQKDSIDNFMVSNRLVREASESRKKAIIQQLKQTKNAKELRLEIRKIRASLSDEFRKRKQILRESEKQLAVQRRFNSSITQMIGGLGSVYALTTAVGSSLRTGMAMEGMEKSFKVVSADSKAAAENMEWVRKEAMRLGAPIVEASKGFASMIAAAGNKMSMDDLKATFTGIQEAGVALGLSREDLGGTILAVKQMLSRLLGRVNFLNSGNILTF